MTKFVKDVLGHENSLNIICPSLSSMFLVSIVNCRKSDSESAMVSHFWFWHYFLAHFPKI